MQNFVGVCVADAAEQAWIGKGALQRMIGGLQNVGEFREAGVEDIDTAGVERPQAGVARDDIEGGAVLRAGLGEGERSIIEFECCLLYTSRCV